MNRQAASVWLQLRSVLRKHNDIGAATMKSIHLVLAFVVSMVLASSTPAEPLVLVSASYGKNVIALCELDGTVLWKFDTLGGQSGHAGHHEVQMLDNGNILFHDDWNTVKEMKLDGSIVWSYKSKGVHAFTRLADGNTMIAESGNGRIIVVDQAGELVSETKLGKDGRGKTRQAEVLANGNYLVCAEVPGAVTEYKPDGEIVWEHKVGSRVYGAIRLKNGNTLIGTGSGNAFVEVSPEHEVIWQMKRTLPGTNKKIAWAASVKELANGHLILNNCHAGADSPQLIEVDKDKKVVWEFNEFELVGNGMACFDYLTAEQAAKVRKRVAALPKK